RISGGACAPPTPGGRTASRVTPSRLTTDTSPRTSLRFSSARTHGERERRWPRYVPKQLAMPYFGLAVGVGTVVYKTQHLVREGIKHGDLDEAVEKPRSRADRALEDL